MELTRKAIYNLWKSIEIDNFSAMKLLYLIGYDYNQCNEIIQDWIMAQKYM